MNLGLFYYEHLPALSLLEDAARQVGFVPHLLHLQDLHFNVDQKSSFLRAGKVEVKDLSLIFVRGFWQYQSEVSLLARYCNAHDVPLYDSALKTEHAVSKNNDLHDFIEAGLPVIPTLFTQSSNAQEEIMQSLEFPIVAKEIRGKRGLDVHLLRNEKQLSEFLFEHIPAEKTLDTHTYQFQPLIPADYDVRVIVIGGKVIGAIERRSADPTDFRHNISLGGSARQIEVTPEMEEISLKVAKKLKYEFAGVDFITDRTNGKTYLLEVNRSPGFEGFMKATGIDVPFELMNFFLPLAKKEIQ